MTAVVGHYADTNTNSIDKQNVAKNDVKSGMYTRASTRGQAFHSNAIAQPQCRNSNNRQVAPILVLRTYFKIKNIIIGNTDTTTTNKCRRATTPTRTR